MEGGKSRIEKFQGMVALLTHWGMYRLWMVLWIGSLSWCTGQTQSAFIADSLQNPLFRHLPIRNSREWKNAVPEIKRAFEAEVYGSFPSEKPDVKADRTLTESGNGFRRELWSLRLDLPESPTFQVEFLIPDLPAGRKPVFMTQWNHRSWGILAVKRGYAACIYAGSDDQDDSKGLKLLFPKAGFATLGQRAWLASRVLDFVDRQSWADTQKVALAGHSRNGKQTLLGGAFDTRFDALILSSAGTGGELPWRMAQSFYHNESLAQITSKFPHWFCPELKKYEGREVFLPVDQHLLLGLAAPRPMLVVSARHEAQANNLGTHQAISAARKVYGWLGKKDMVSVWYREGEHSTDAGLIEVWLDWLDGVWGFREFQGFPSGNLKPFPDPPVFSNVTGFGIAPPEVPNLRIPQLKDRLPADHPVSQMMTDPIRRYTDSVSRWVIGPYKELGEYNWAHLYLPSQDGWSADTASGKKFPVVIFLHSEVPNTGFRKDSRALILSFTRQGFAVICFDQAGCGVRQDEVSGFYRRFPQWTLAGKRIRDARACLELVRSNTHLNDQQVFVVGSGSGAWLALQAFDQVGKIRKMGLIDPLFGFLGENGSDYGRWLERIAFLCPGKTWTRYRVLGQIRSMDIPVKYLQPEGTGLGQEPSSPGWQSIRPGEEEGSLSVQTLIRFFREP
jgi:pimeloyl-ACP methyl ester carboxylesterase